MKKHIWNKKACLLIGGKAIEKGGEVDLAELEKVAGKEGVDSYLKNKSVVEGEPSKDKVLVVKQSLSYDKKEKKSGK